MVQLTPAFSVAILEHWVCRMKTSMPSHQSHPVLGPELKKKIHSTLIQLGSRFAPDKRDLELNDVGRSQVAEQAARAAGCLIREQVGAKVIRRKAFAADLLTAVDQNLGSFWLVLEVCSLVNHSVNQ